MRVRVQGEGEGKGEGEGEGGDAIEGLSKEDEDPQRQHIQTNSH